MIELLKEYISWSAKVWCGDVSQPLVLRDYAIMGLGLPGECGEIIEELLPSLEGTGEVSEELLVKELGDCIYYWARVCDAFSIDAELVWPAGVGVAEPKQDLAVMLLRLTVHTAKVAEQVKKRIRDGRYRPELLHAALAGAASAWLDIVAHQRLCVPNILSVNQAKVEERFGRPEVAK